MGFRVWMLQFIGWILFSGNAGALDVISRPDSPPLTYEEEGRPTGMAVEIVDAIQGRLSEKEKIYIVPWARGYKMLQLQPNVVLFTLARTKEREKLFTMIGPIASTQAAIYVKKGSKLNLRSVEDAKKVAKIAVRNQTIYQTLLKQKGFTNLIESVSVFQEYMMLINDRVDVVCDSSLEVEGVIKRENLDASQIHKAFVVANLDLYIGFSKGTSPKIIQSWADALRAIKRDGTFVKIYNKWLPGENPPRDVEIVDIAMRK